MTKHSEDWPVLREVRLQLGLTQREMAERMNTPLVTYKGWEAGRFNPPGVAIAFAREMRPKALPKMYDHSEIARRYIAGESANNIAKAMGCSRPMVYAVLKRQGIKSRGYNSKLPDDAAVADLYLRGKTAVEIARMYRASRNTVRDRLVRAGIPMRPRGWPKGQHRK